MAHHGDGDSTMWYHSSSFNIDPAWAELVECQRKNIAEDVCNMYAKSTLVQLREIQRKI